MKPTMRGLFGEEVAVAPDKTNRRPSLCRGPVGKTCGQCQHRVSVEYHNKRYGKCELMCDRWTHGPGTDVHRKDTACAFFKERN